MSDISGPTLGAGEHLHTIEGRVLVPLLWSLVTAIAAAILFLAVFANWKGAAVMFVVAFIFVWAYAQMRIEGNISRLIGLAETRWNVDIDGNGDIGNDDLQTQRRKVIVDVITDDGTYAEGQILHLDDLDAVTYVAREIMDDKPFSSALIKKRVLSRDAWEAMRNELLERGIIVQTNRNEPRDGYTVTRAGKAFFREMAKDPLP